MIGKIGPYELIGELGRGGLGVVWLARHELLGVERAVKVLRGDLARDREQVARFLREARHLAGSARQPHLVTVHEVGQLPDGGLFLAMDVVPGRDLARVLREEGPLEPDRAARIVREVALAVDALHRLGVVHRDLKPGNVMLRPGDKPCLIDLGLARAFTDSSERLTRSGELMGTPVYMSPEQARGDKDVGPAADVWALGLILHALVAGQPAVAGGGAVEVLERVLKGELTPLELAAPSAPPELCRIRERACRLEPRQRHGSARELAEALERFLAPPGASAEASGSRATPHAGSRAVRVLGLLAATSVAALGSLLLVRALGRERPAVGPGGVAALASPAPPGSAEAPAGPVGSFQLVEREEWFELRGPTDCVFDRAGDLLIVAAAGKNGLLQLGVDAGRWGTRGQAAVRASGCALSPDGTRALAIASEEASILHVASGGITRLTPPPGPPCGALGPQGQVALAGGSTVAVRDSLGAKLFERDLDRQVLACAFRPRGELLCLVAGSELVELDPRGDRRSWSFPAGALRSCAFSPDGAHLALVGPGGWTVVGTEDGSPARSGRLEAASIDACALTCGGRLLAIGGQAGLLLFDTTRPEAEPVRQAPRGGAVDACGFSWDGKLLATGGKDGLLLLWNVRWPE